MELKNQITYSAGIDSSLRASLNTLENLNKSGVKGDHKVYLSSWKSFLNRSNKWEVITMNPPYLDSREWTQELKFDPRNSLVASKQGASHYQELLDYLKRNNYWKLVVLECSEYHESFWEEIERLNTNWTLKRYKDYLGKFRVVSITRK
ncbi:hypothetical protein WEN_03345 [Mycoplasma wenyonii str. Massachusetts]|uniref:Uncharacterized protein n=1 Tax=Mycoplasma wenyonii (strain Massachusetts) TaxID=1197325 RepID=I6YBQ5_MYCWM|nr:hypothetical protein WEN_03345 [Mycoplasma wenyonii str. Massachusetts]